MALILRASKVEIPMMVRSYGTQRHQHNYYETLRVSPTATQKEIKQAFIKLSKEMHPDIRGANSHLDFVKINEAYSVLSKENSRQQYDTNLRYNNVRQSTAGADYYYYYQPAGRWETHGRSNQWNANETPIGYWKVVMVCICIAVVGATLQIINIRRYFDRRDRAIERSRKINEELKARRKNPMTLEELEQLSNPENVKKIYQMYKRHVD